MGVEGVQGERRAGDIQTRNLAIAATASSRSRQVGRTTPWQAGIFECGLNGKRQAARPGFVFDFAAADMGEKQDGVDGNACRRKLPRLSDEVTE